MPRRPVRKPRTEEPPAVPNARSVHAEVVLLAAAVLLLCLLCYLVYPVLSPFVVFAGLVFLLYPFRHQTVARRFIYLGSFLAAFWFFFSLLGLLAPFIIAFLLAYVLDPLVTLLERRRMPRWVSSLVIIALLLGTVATVAVFVVPVAVEQLQSVTGQAGILADQFNHTIRSGALFDLLARFGVSVEKAKETLLEYVTPKVEELLKQLFEALFGVVTSLTSVVHQLLNIIIIPFILFYLLMDFPRVTHQCAMLVPEHSRDHYKRLTGLTDQLMGRYCRGAILVALIQGTISGLTLWLIGVDYALVLGIMTSVLNFVPYVGLAVSLVVASIVALLSGGAVWMKVLFVAILYFGQKLLEATVLGPKIIGPQVGLHPVLLILCLMVFGYFLGFVGLLIAVPATALIIAAVKEWEAVRTRHRAPAA